MHRSLGVPRARARPPASQGPKPMARRDSAAAGRAGGARAVAASGLEREPADYSSFLLKIFSYSYTNRNTVVDLLVGSPEFAAFLQREGISKFPRGWAGSLPLTHANVLNRFVDECFLRLPSNHRLRLGAESKALSLLADAPIFRTALGEKGVAKYRQMPIKAQRATANRVLGHCFRRLIRPAVLRALRNEALLADLRQHGAKIETKDARAAIARLSRENVQRLLGTKGPAAPDPALAEVKALVDGIEVVLVHNTVNLRELGSTPVLSSRQLQKIGAPGGRNTQPFNREFLRSDDNVFFFVKFKTQAMQANGGASVYGDDALTVRPAYAHEAAWVSAFVMNPADLAVAAKKLGIPLDPSGKWLEDGKLPAPEWREASRRLHRLDFTLPDFAGMVRSQMLTSLAGLRRSKPAEFSRVVSVLRGEDPIELAKVIEAYAYEPLRLPPIMEGKIPVAIPPREIVRLPKTKS